MTFRGPLNAADTLLLTLGGRLALAGHLLPLFPDNLLLIFIYMLYFCLVYWRNGLQAAVYLSNMPLLRLKMTQSRHDDCGLVTLNEWGATPSEAFSASTRRAGAIFPPSCVVNRSNTTTGMLGVRAKQEARAENNYESLFPPCWKKKSPPAVINLKGQQPLLWVSFLRFNNVTNFINWAWSCTNG